MLGLPLVLQAQPVQEVDIVYPFKRAMQIVRHLAFCPGTGAQARIHLFCTAVAVRCVHSVVPIDKGKTRISSWPAQRRLPGGHVRSARLIRGRREVVLYAIDRDIGDSRNR